MWDKVYSYKTQLHDDFQVVKLQSRVCKTFPDVGVNDFK